MIHKLIYSTCIKCLALCLLFGIANAQDENSDDCSKYGGMSNKFIGKVIKIEKVKRPASNVFEDLAKLLPKNPELLHFAIEKSYSGDKSKEIEVYIGIKEECTNLVLSVAERYLVYAKGIGLKGEPPLVIDRCLTKPVSKATEEIKHLDWITRPGSIFEEMNSVVKFGILSGKAVSKPPLVYPKEAKKRRVAGTVNVAVIVDETGKIIRAEAICGPSLLRESAEKAAYQWRFSPTLLSGKPVKVGGVIVFNYTLQ
jgi:TonB family protein